MKEAVSYFFQKEKNANPLAGIVRRMMRLKKKESTSCFFISDGKRKIDINNFEVLMGDCVLIDRDTILMFDYVIDEQLFHRIGTINFSPSQAYVFLDGHLDDSNIRYYLSNLKKEYNNSSRHGFYYKDVGDAVSVEGRVIEENGGIVRLKNPVYYGVCPETGEEMFATFREGYLRKEGLANYDEIGDFSEIEKELLQGLEAMQEEKRKEISKKTKYNHLRLIKG